MSDAGVDPLPYSVRDLELALGDGWRETLLGAHRWMTFARVLDARMLALQRQGRIGFYGPATGQEAVSVGAALAAGPEDWVFPGLREQLVALARGHSLTRYLHHLFADDLDPARGRQMPCHPTAREVRYVSMSSVIGTQITQAVGFAYALKLKHETAVALAFFGDGATSGNDFHAGLNFAAVFQLPVVFCLTNNQWAISVPVERQTRTRELAEKAAAYGLPGRRVDGTDLIAVVQELKTVLAAARAGHGPALLEFLLYRMTPHSSSDDPGRYQPSDFLPRARRKDPVARLEELLRRFGALTDEALRAEQADAEARVRAAVEEAEHAPPPSPDSLTTDVFAPGPSSAPPGSG